MTTSLITALGSHTRGWVNDLLAESEDTSYVACVSEQNWLIDESGIPVNDPEVARVFGEFLDNSYEIPSSYRN